MEFLKDLSMAVGGAVGAVLIILVFFKGILQKWIDTTIEKAAEKSLVKYSNTLERKTKAYEMLLEKECSFYERTSQIMSALCKDLAEYSLYSGIGVSITSLIDSNEAAISAERLTKISTNFTQDQMVNSCYIPENISDCCQELVEVLTEMQVVLCQTAISVCENKVTDEDKKSLLQLQDNIDEKCAKLMTMIKFRLIELSDQ